MTYKTIDLDWTDGILDIEETLKLNGFDAENFDYVIHLSSGWEWPRVTFFSEKKEQLLDLLDVYFDGIESDERLSEMISVVPVQTL